MTLYEDIGEETLRTVITEFYKRAFADPIIGHFFFHFDRHHLTEQQIDFARALLDGPQRYQGKPLKAAHAPFDIRKPHFGRRQVLMREVLDDYGVAPRLRDAWLEREERLKPLILSSSQADTLKGL
jgi:hemoglobin